MATIDKAKGQAVEEHSLSSFDKKRGKVAAYSAQKHKKYRVVSVQKMERADIHGHIGKTSEKSESTSQTSKLCGKFFTARIAITIAIGKEKKRVKHRKIRSIAVFSQTPKTQFQYLRQLLPKWRRE